MSDRMYYAYKVTNLSTGRSYYVNADHLVDLTQVWRNQMDFFMKEAKDGKAEKA